MGKHTCEHMMMPAGKFSHLIVVHTQFGFCFLKTLFNGPAQPTEPDQCFEPDTGGCIGYKKRILGLRGDVAPDQQPDRPCRLAVLAEYHLAPGEFIFDRPFGPF